MQPTYFRQIAINNKQAVSKSRLANALRSFVICLLCSFCLFSARAQQKEVDRLQAFLDNYSKADSVRVDTLNELAYTYNRFNPALSLVSGKEALELAKKIKYWRGESRALSIMANSYNITGNYNRAMEIYLQVLEISEKRNIPDKLASSLMNIGILFTQQLDYKKALPYYLRSDSIIRINKLEKLAYNSFQNLGDIYERMNRLDSAFYYYNRSLSKAVELKNNYYIGATLSGLGSSYIKRNEKQQGLSYYYSALHYLALANEEDLYCETVYNMANLFAKDNKNDSALYYVRLMLALAEKDHFQSRMLDASSFLASFYKKENRSDSALLYLEKTTLLKDTLNSLEKIKDFQQKSFNEEIRQAELAEKKRKEEEERSQQLQLLIIGIFIPIFFLATVFLSRKKIHRKAIQILGIISLLLLFEYLTLLLHPFVVEITHHTPVIELLIFVSIAAVLIPGHHRIEAWLIEKLTHIHRTDSDHIHIKKSALNIKKPSE